MTGIFYRPLLGIFKDDLSRVHFRQSPWPGSFTGRFQAQSVRIFHGSILDIIRDRDHSQAVYGYT